MKQSELGACHWEGEVVGAVQLETTLENKARAKAAKVLKGVDFILR